MVLDRENRLNLQANAAIVYKIDIELYKRVLQWAVRGSMLFTWKIGKNSIKIQRLFLLKVLEWAGQAKGLHAGLKLSTN